MGPDIIEDAGKAVGGVLGGIPGLIIGDKIGDAVSAAFGTEAPAAKEPSAEEKARQKRALEEMDARDAREKRTALARKSPGRTGTILSGSEATGAGQVSAFPFVME